MIENIGVQVFESRVFEMSLVLGRIVLCLHLFEKVKTLANQVFGERVLRGTSSIIENFDIGDKSKSVKSFSQV